MSGIETSPALTGRLGKISGSHSLVTEVHWSRWELFKLAVWTSILTVVTLGFYRFWKKTRVRQFIWEAIHPGGTPVEYTGRPSEKLNGFMITISIVAIYVGLASLLVSYASLRLFNTLSLSFGVFLIIISPLIYFARYQSRRYILSRTQWRGIRFYMAPDGWRYVRLCFLWWAMTVVTLGLLYPRQLFMQEKFLTDRTFFGSKKMVQNGKWTMLLGKYMLVYAGACVTFLISSAIPVDSDTLGGVGVAFIAGVLWTLAALVYFRARSFQIMTNHKRIGDGIHLRSAVRARRILSINVFGRILAYLLLLPALIFGLLLLGLLLPGEDQSLLSVSAASGFLLAACVFLILILRSALLQVFVHIPIMSHYLSTLEIGGIGQLSMVTNRGSEGPGDAGGLAEAVDLGGGL